MSRCKDFYEKWEREPNWCEKCPEAVRLIENYMSLVKKLEAKGVPKETTFVGLTETAARPLIAEKNPEIREKALEKISKDLKGKKGAGRGHKKKLTASDVEVILSNAKVDKVIQQSEDSKQEPEIQARPEPEEPEPCPKGNKDCDNCLHWRINEGGCCFDWDTKCSYIPKQPLKDTLTICPCGCGYGYDEFSEKWYSPQEMEGKYV